MKDQHFFAASVSQWATTNEERDLSALCALMEKAGQTYNLFLVPVPHTDTYEIEMFQPMVQGSQWLGTFILPKKKGSRK
jgi:hypothetical protein